MLIGQFNDSFPPIVDGVANVCLNYAMEITKRGDSCIAVTPRIPGARSDYPFKLYSFGSLKVPKRNEYRWGIGTMDARFWKKIKNEPFDIVHSHSPFSAHYVAQILARRQNIPLVTTFHTKYKDDFQQELKAEPLVRIVVKHIISAYNDADEVWTVNESSVEILREYGYKGDVYIVENGCDIQPKDPTAGVKSEVSDRFHLSDAPLLIYIGQHVMVKNHDLLLEALAALKRGHARFHMLFIGDGNYRNEMEMFVSRNGLEDCVTFAGMIRDRELISKIYLSATAMVFPSLYDTSSLAPREAAACLCPTVFIEGSSTAQGISDGENGFLSENTPAAYAAKLKYILENPDARDKAARGARNMLYRSWETAVDKAFDRYGHLIEKKKSTIQGRGKNIRKH